MPINLKRGLSQLARAQAGLSAKQLRRSARDYSAQKTVVAEKLRGAFLTKTATPPQAAEKPKTPEESESEKPESEEKIPSEKPS